MSGSALLACDDMKPPTPNLVDRGTFVSELTSGLKAALDQTVEVHNRLMIAYQEAAVGEGATSGSIPNATRPSLEILSAVADLKSAYTKLGNLILQLDPDALG